MRTKIETQNLGIPPSEIDENAGVACPFFAREERAFSTIYSRQHAQAASYLTALLQERFHSVQVEGEAPLTSGGRGFMDLKFVLRESRILVENAGKVLCVLEVKTGSVKICQPAYYASAEDAPVLLAEAKTGDVFAVTPEAGRSYLRLIEDILRVKSVLESRGIYCPSSYCRYCTNSGCPHIRKRREAEPRVSFLLDENLKAFSRNLPGIVEKVSRFIEDLLSSQNGMLEPQLAPTAKAEGNGR